MDASLDKLSTACPRPRRTATFVLVLVATAPLWSLVDEAEDIVARAEQVSPSSGKVSHACYGWSNSASTTFSNAGCNASNRAV